MAGGKNRGGYHGGGTIMSSRDPSWFSKDSAKRNPEDRLVVVPARTAAEQREYDDLKRKMAEPVHTLIKRSDVGPAFRKRKK